MPEDEEEDGEESEVRERNPDWIHSVDDLAKAGGPVESREFNPDLDHLSDDSIRFLEEQTTRILDRHAEIEQDQRRHASSIIRITLVIIGAIGTAIPFVISFIRTITFPAQIHPVNAALSLLLLIFVGWMMEAIVFDIYSIVDSTFDILTPMKTERGLVGRIFTLFNILGTEPKDEEAGGGIRSVSILNELAPVIDNPGEELSREVLVNRLNRINRNERVIDQNITHLHDIYQRAKLGMERTVVIFLLLLVTFILLGGSF